MIASDLIWRSASDQRRLLDAGEVSAVELTRAYLTRMDAVEPALHCHLHRMDEIALAQAAAADKRIREGDVSPMTRPVPPGNRTSTATVRATSLGSRPAARQAPSTLRRSGS